MDRRRIQVSVDGRTAVFGPGLPEIVVGRQAGCFIRPDGAGVGERHLVPRHGEDGWTLEALDAQRVYHEGRLVERLKITRKTGECPLCGGRVRLGGDARLRDHTSAAAAER